MNIKSSNIPSWHPIFWITLCLHTSLILCIGCKKEIINSSVPSPTSANHSSPYGIPTGTEEQFLVDETGGEFHTSDDRVTLIIPTNIATSGTRFTVQEISNTCPSSFGTAYRIFADQPLSGSFHVQLSYANEIDSIGIQPECMLGIALLDSINGTWYLQSNRTLSISGMYASITMQGGDCAFARPVRLDPTFSVIRPLEDVVFTLKGSITLPSGGICEIFQPNASPLAMQQEYVLESHMIDYWQVLSAGSGTGTLTPLGSRANYQASIFELPPINPVTILVFLTSSDVPLSAQVFVQSNLPGLKIWIGNNQYVFTNDEIEVGLNGDGSMGMYWENSQGMGSINWRRNKNGTYAWNESDTYFLFEPANISPLQAFTSYYNDELTVSDGDVRITASGSVGQAISGTFVIPNSGRTNMESGQAEYMGTSHVTGVFNVMFDS